MLLGFGDFLHFVVAKTHIVHTKAIFVAAIGFTVRKSLEYQPLTLTRCITSKRTGIDYA